MIAGCRQPRDKKKGYYPKVESLDEGWVVNEYLKGNYLKDYYIIQGERKKAWKVSTMRELRKKE